MMIEWEFYLNKIIFIKIYQWVEGKMPMMKI